MQCIRLQGLAGILVGHAFERARAPIIEHDGEAHDEHGPDARLNVKNGVKEQAADGLPDDPDTGCQEQAGLDEGGDVLYLAVAVLMYRIGGQIADPDGKQGDDGGHQIERGVQGLGENAEASAPESDNKFENRDDNGDQHTIARHALLFRAHAVLIERHRRIRGRRRPRSWLPGVVGYPLLTGRHAISFPSKRRRRRRCMACRQPHETPWPS